MDTIASLASRDKLTGIIISRGGLSDIRSVGPIGKAKRNRNGACAACGCEIPPGRAGRKCKACLVETPRPSVSDIDLIYTLELTDEQIADMERHERDGTAKFRG